MTTATAWAEIGKVVHDVTGRTLVGTGGGRYVATSAGIYVPNWDMDAAIHELAHFVVASEDERRQRNWGLSTDWDHHLDEDFDRMVLREEQTWSLQLYLFGDPSPERIVEIMSPEAAFTDGGSYGGGYVSSTPAKKPDTVTQNDAEASKAEIAKARDLLVRHGEMRPEGTEELRRFALRRAEELGLPVAKIKRIIADWEKFQESEAADLKEQLQAVREAVRLLDGIGRWVYQYHPMRRADLEMSLARQRLEGGNYGDAIAHCAEAEKFLRKAEAELRTEVCEFKEKEAAAKKLSNYSRARDQRVEREESEQRLQAIERYFQVMKGFRTEWTYTLK